ncbi:MAG: serine/threonine-protein kinase [Phycisphaerales bacterium]|jgi:tRNA A-37 threonylcarbamoyl transferase component Bud32|nr:serine/threonine-protein kinase [Phycisphaerales bacterium]
MIGRKIGPCTLRRVIGRGGMGTVYEALQENPRRAVAVKMMRRGITSKKALRRFEFEAQVLGRLKHPGIAAVYEAGAHDDGEGPVPYFVMEYIPNAVPITQYASDKKLSTRDRLELFAKVCEAVQHGHMKGIVHRDLKPGNIIVDSSGQPKIIDFGVARSTDSDLAVTTLQTDVGALIGTLQYMSPEQVAADPHDIDTRSDVYSLGITLYELLTGRPPYDVKTLAIHEAVQVIRDEEPTRLSTIDRHLRGDIETIALKAIDKERGHRYQSAGELRDDINRYLVGDAISATPPSLWSQVRRLAKRNVAATVAGVSILLVILVAAVGVSWFAVAAANERAEKAAAQSKVIEQEQQTRMATATMDMALEFAADMANANQMALSAADLGVDEDAFIDNLLTRKEALARERFVAGDERSQRALGAVLLQVGFGYLAHSPAKWGQARENLLEGVELLRSAAPGFKRGGNSLQGWIGTRGVAPALLLLHGISKIDLGLTEEERDRFAPLWQDAQPLLAGMDIDALGEQIWMSLSPKDLDDSDVGETASLFNRALYSGLVSQELGLGNAFNFQRVAETVMSVDDPMVEQRVDTLGTDLMVSLGLQQPEKAWAELSLLLGDSIPLFLSSTVDQEVFAGGLETGFLIGELGLAKLAGRFGRWSSTYDLQGVIDSLGSQPLSEACGDLLEILQCQALWNLLHAYVQTHEKIDGEELQAMATDAGVPEKFWQNGWGRDALDAVHDAYFAESQSPAFREAILAKLAPLEQAGLHMTLEARSYSVFINGGELLSWLNGSPNPIRGETGGDAKSDLAN